MQLQCKPAHELERITEPLYYPANEHGQRLPANEAARQECERWNAFARRYSLSTHQQGAPA